MKLKNLPVRCPWIISSRQKSISYVIIKQEDGKDVAGNYYSDHFAVVAEYGYVPGE